MHHWQMMELILSQQIRGVGQGVIGRYSYQPGGHNILHYHGLLSPWCTTNLHNNTAGWAWSVVGPIFRRPCWEPHPLHVRSVTRACILRPPYNDSISSSVLTKELDNIEYGRGSEKKPIASGNDA